MTNLALLAVLQKGEAGLHVRVSVYTIALQHMNREFRNRLESTKSYLYGNYMSAACSVTVHSVSKIWNSSIDFGDLINGNGCANMPNWREIERVRGWTGRDCDQDITIKQAIIESAIVDLHLKSLGPIIMFVFNHIWHLQSQGGSFVIKILLDLSEDHAR